MTKATVVVFLLLLFSISNLRYADLLIHQSLEKFLGSFVIAKQVRIPDLLNQLCNDSQGSSGTRRDACYGCFYRSSVLPRGYAMLIAMSACADTYLNNTSYGPCQAYLRNATRTSDTRASPTTIYCTFLECIRQVNKDAPDIDIRGGSRARLSSRGAALRTERQPFLFLKPFSVRRGVCLIQETATDSAATTDVSPTVPLRQCVPEAAGMFPSLNRTDATRLAQLYVNTTTCVLAKTRCSYTNPVTGQLQDDGIVNKLHLASINAVLVNTDYDVNIVNSCRIASVVSTCARSTETSGRRLGPV